MPKYAFIVRDVDEDCTDTSKRLWNTREEALQALREHITRAYTDAGEHCPPIREVPRYIVENSIDGIETDDLVGNIVEFEDYD